MPRHGKYSRDKGGMPTWKYSKDPMAAWTKIKGGREHYQVHVQDRIYDVEGAHDNKGGYFLTVIPTDRAIEYVTYIGRLGDEITGWEDGKEVKYPRFKTLAEARAAAAKHYDKWMHKIKFAPRGSDLSARPKHRGASKSGGWMQGSMKPPRRKK